MRPFVRASLAALLFSSVVLPVVAATPKVWVNTDPSSKTYHCQGSQYYGKTKSGEYMTEAQAKAAGNKPAADKPCS